MSKLIRTNILLFVIFIISLFVSIFLIIIQLNICCTYYKTLVQYAQAILLAIVAAYIFYTFQVIVPKLKLSKFINDRLVILEGILNTICLLPIGPLEIDTKIENQINQEEINNYCNILNKNYASKIRNTQKGPCYCLLWKDISESPLLKETFNECKNLLSEIYELYNLHGNYLHKKQIEILENILYSPLIFDTKEIEKNKKAELYFPNFQTLYLSNYHLKTKLSIIINKY